MTLNNLSYSMIFKPLMLKHKWNSFRLLKKNLYNFICQDDKKFNFAVERELREPNQSFIY